MKRLGHMLALGGLIMACGLATSAVQAQQGGQGGQRGGFDPEQMRARMMERYKEQLEVKDDAAWKVLEERIQKVTEAQREAMMGRMGGMGRGMMGMGARNREGGDQAGQGGNRQQGDRQQAQGSDRRQRGGMFGEPSAEAEALQKAIENKAPNDELKTKMAALREVQKAKQAKLTAAQEELRKLLTVRQEAILVASGTLN